MSGDRAPATRVPATTFRTAGLADAPAICGLFSSEEELFLAYSQGRHPFSVEQASRLIEKRMAPTVVLADEEIAGFGCLYRYREARSVFIGNIVISQRRRRSGLARRLVRHLIDLAFDELDLPRVRVHVFHRNLGALLLYEDLGFQPYAFKRRIDRAGNDVLLLNLELDRAVARRAETRHPDGRPARHRTARRQR